MTDEPDDPLIARSRAAQVAEARAYIAAYRGHTMPTVKFVDIDARRLTLASLDDDDAIIVAGVFSRSAQQEADRARAKGRPKQ